MNDCSAETAERRINMITTKERATLRGLAQKLDPIFQIGKNGVTDTLVEQLSDALEARELIKITVLNSAVAGAKDIINGLSEALDADPVQAIGNKIVIYRRSKRKDAVHLL